MILDELDREIEELKKQLRDVQAIRDSVANDKLTVYFEKDDSADWLNPYPWAFENDIIMSVDETMIRVPVDKAKDRRASYVVYRFKREEDVVAFKLRWL